MQPANTVFCHEKTEYCFSWREELVREGREGEIEISKDGERHMRVTTIILCGCRKQRLTDLHVSEVYAWHHSVNHFSFCLQRSLLIQRLQ
ncbi:Delta-Like Protein 4 [Manis pentadactyla]|nr:Delta-Like Protein 4 [Manis pentadactyla]